MNWLFNLFVENASPVELFVLAWIAWRVESFQARMRVMERLQFNLQSRQNELWADVQTLEGKIAHGNSESEPH